MDRDVWISFVVFAAVMFVVVACVNSFIVPRIGVTYCTVRFDTCITEVATVHGML
jgi:membrane protein YdbS with pleckstrin-like domain